MHFRSDHFVKCCVIEYDEVKRLKNNIYFINMRKTLLTLAFQYLDVFSECP